MLIIEHISVVTVAEWFDGSQSRWLDTLKSQNMYLTFLSLKQ